MLKTTRGGYPFFSFLRQDSERKTGFPEVEVVWDIDI